MQDYEEASFGDAFGGGFAELRGQGQGVAGFQGSVEGSGDLRHLEFGFVDEFQAEMADAGA